MPKETKQDKKQGQVKKEKETTEIKAKSIIRIATTDISGEASIYSGLTKIKGISWAFSSAICATLGIEKERKINNLSEKEINKIEEFIKNPILPGFLLNRRKDFETGQNKHLITTDLDLQKEFDIRRLKKIRSYRGWRHAIGLPVRGQRTKAHFRKGRVVGVVKSKAKMSKKA